MASFRSFPAMPYAPAKNSRFCRVVSMPYMENFWATYPTFLRARAAAVRRSAPATLSVPLVAGSSPQSMRKVVLFPAPVRPQQAEDLPFPDGEADVVDGGEIAESAYEVRDPDDDVPFRRLVPGPVFLPERERLRAPGPFVPPAGS